MSTTYGLPDADVTELLADVMERHHRPLHDAGVRVGVLMAGNDNGPAVKHGGYPAYATVRVVPLKDRLTKGYDAELVLDRDEWDRFRHRHRLALIDHELSHLALARHSYAEDADTGEKTDILFARDDLGRPKLKLVKGDWNAGDGFVAVVERHKEFAIEFLNLKRCHTFAVAAKDGVSPETQRLSDLLTGHQATIKFGREAEEGSGDAHADGEG